MENDTRSAGKENERKKETIYWNSVCLIVIIIGLGWYLISIFVQDRQSEENYDALATATLTEAEATEKTMTNRQFLSPKFYRKPMLLKS